jgi:hypothetical protein
MKCYPLADGVIVIIKPSACWCGIGPSSVVVNVLSSAVVEIDAATATGVAAAGIWPQLITLGNAFSGVGAITGRIIVLVPLIPLLLTGFPIEMTLVSALVRSRPSLPRGRTECEERS